ncbi:MAG: Na+/H+ antiporter NhaC family protein [Lachnospiraceae bacterium]|nr:Na+/H+ antiporter NhaC family protein [Lachnospiraceae bacterium]
MEFLVLGAFCAGLILCFALDLPILCGLVFGWFLFVWYGRHRGFSWRELIHMSLNGIRTVQNILITFFLIGIMTALWRMAGTIPFIVCHATRLIRPFVFLLMTFLLNSGLSFLTGTSFGTAATMGVICAAMGVSMHVSPILTGGAVLSGAFFGDRCSPVSTSALLVAAVTKTDIYDNIRRMVKSALVPFLLTCLIYGVLGFMLPGEGEIMDLNALYTRTFRLNWITVIPALTILVLAICRVNVKIAMTASILTAIPICLFIQGVPGMEVLAACVNGYHPKDAELAAMMSGGGVISMVRVACIVCISSAYSDILNRTGLLDGAKKAVASAAHRTTSFAAVFLCSVISGMIACNQTLTILLTSQLCGDLYADRGQLAVDLEDTAVVIAPLIPWSIAGAVPLAAVDAPSTAILTSFYLIILPLYRMAAAAAGKGRK